MDISYENTADKWQKAEDKVDCLVRASSVHHVTRQQSLGAYQQRLHVDSPSEQRPGRHRNSKGY